MFSQYRSGSNQSHSSRNPTAQHFEDDRSKSLLCERDAQISALEKEVTFLTNKLSTLSKKHQKAVDGGVGSHPKRRHHPLTPYGNLVQETELKSGGKRMQLQSLRERMGRSASIATRSVLNALPDEEATKSSSHSLAERIVDMFKDPASHIDYLNSDQFARDLLRLCSKVKPILESEPRVAFLQSPAYVFGDIHGNLEDLHFFSDNIWRLGMALTAGNFVFLGDYVDRGMSCLEVVAYLFAMKLLLPHKVFLLRGNHETRDVNGWEEHYGERSFIYQCRDRFGDDLGFRVWEQTNQAFDRLPLAGVIDQDIFCVHGGIPRPVTELDDGSNGSRIQDILSVPKVSGINPPYEHEREDQQQVASDCIWSDPASDEQEEHGVDPDTGFGDSLRGGGAICFGHRAVTDFLQQQNLSYIMRAHEAHAEGVAVSKGARVFTVFSTSKDHNQGNQAMAGCILVDFEKMQVINRSPAYRNQYVHRRDSVSLAMLSEQEIKDRMRLGLITAEPGNDEDEDEDYEEEQWENLEDDNVDRGDNDGGSDASEESFDLKIDTNRKSSVDPIHTMASPPGSTHDNHVWGTDDDLDQTGSNKRIDFSNVEVSDRKKKRELKRFSVIKEEEDDEDDSTTEGIDEGDENMDFMDENQNPGSREATVSSIKSGRVKLKKDRHEKYAAGKSSF